MNSHRTYFDPPRTSPVRRTQWLAPVRKGHRAFLVLSPAKKANP